MFFADRKTAPQTARMNANGGSAPVPSNIVLTDYLDPSTLQQLQNLQVISPSQSAAIEQPKGTDFLEIANRVSCVFLLPFFDVLAIVSNHFF